MFVCAQYVFPCAPLHTASNVHRLMICVLVVMTAPRFLKEGSRKYQRPIDWKNCESEYMPSYFFLPLSHTHTHTHTQAHHPLTPPSSHTPPSPPPSTFLTHPECSQTTSLLVSLPSLPVDPTEPSSITSVCGGGEEGRVCVEEGGVVVCEGSECVLWCVT